MGVALYPILFLCVRLVTLSLRRRPAAAGSGSSAGRNGQEGGAAANPIAPWCQGVGGGQDPGCLGQPAESGVMWSFDPARNQGKITTGMTRRSGPGRGSGLP